MVEWTAEEVREKLRELILDMYNSYPKNPDVLAGMEIVISELKSRFGLGTNKRHYPVLGFQVSKDAGCVTPPTKVSWTDVTFAMPEPQKDRSNVRLTGARTDRHWPYLHPGRACGDGVCGEGCPNRKTAEVPVVLPRVERCPDCGRTQGRHNVGCLRKHPVRF